MTTAAQKPKSRLATLLSSKRPNATPPTRVLNGKGEDVKREFAFMGGMYGPGDVARLSIQERLINTLDLQRGTGDVATLGILALPKDRVGRTRRAQTWAEEDDFTQSLMDIKSKFTRLGWKIQATPKTEAENDLPSASEMTSAAGELSEIAILTDLYKVITDVIRDWYVTDNLILHWKINPGVALGGSGSEDAPITKNNKAIPGLQYIGTLNPADVTWDNALGNDRLYVDVPQALVMRITIAWKYPDRQKAIQALIDEGIDQKWITAVTTALGKGEKAGQVELRNDDGEYWLIRTTARKHYGLSFPSMYTVFLAQESRRMFCDGEFAAAYMMKHFIQHLTMGESITTGPFAGSTQNWPTSEEIDALLEKFANVQKTMRIGTNHTVKIQFVYPPAEMFALDKFASPESRILRWAGVNSALIGGDKQTVAEGFIGLKRMIADMADTRKLISDLLRDFFRHDSIRSRIKIDERFDASCQFDENVLKDPRQLLDEVKFLVTEGVGDPEMTLRELGRDPEATRMSKVRSIHLNEAERVYEPVYDRQAKQGQSPQDGAAGGSSGGRPAKPGQEGNDKTRQQRPTTTDSNKD